MEALKTLDAENTESQISQIYDHITSHFANTLNKVESVEKTHVTPLKPFKPFTKVSYYELVEREKERKAKEAERAKHAQEAHLKDGVLYFGLAEDDEDDVILGVNADLEEGKILSKKFGECPKHLIGKPIEDLDLGIEDQTFMVIGTNCGKNMIFRFSATNSLFIFSPWNKARQALLYLLTLQWFDIFILLAILGNCVFLAIPDFKYSDEMEYVFLAVYTFEMCVRITARGFVLQKHTYLRDPWNMMDFIVIMLGFVLELLPLVGASDNESLDNVSALRTFRVFRALKTINIVPGLKTIVSALLRAFRMLFEVILLTGFCLIVFAMFGIQVYNGVLRQKCVRHIGGYINTTTQVEQSEAEFAYNWDTDKVNWFNDGGEGYEVICSLNGTKGAGHCPVDYTCKADIGDNPRWGFLNFDHVGWSLLTCFQLITLDFWEDVYGKVLRSQGPWHVLYFMVVVFFGAFYLINLMLAVVSMSYEEETVKANTEQHKKMQDEARAKHNDTLPNDDKGQHNGDSNPIPSIQSAIDNDHNNSAQRSGAFNIVQHQHLSKSQSQTQTLFVKTPERHEHIPASDLNHFYIEKADELLDPIGGGPYHGILVDRNFACCGRCCIPFVCFLKVQQQFFVFVSDPLFDLFISFCIFVNTAFMASEAYPAIIPKDFLTVTNYIFSVIFIFEAVCKLMAWGKYYFRSTWNLFDLFIVLTSIADMILQIYNHLYGGSGGPPIDLSVITVMRTFRLMRVFKLAQSWATMRLLISIIVNTLGALGNLCFILVIVIYIFAVMGLQLFRNDYSPDKFGEDGVPRWHFKTFEKSMLMIFRVLCGEWVEASWDCMRAKSEICLVVFLPALVLGNFIVLNLFLALLLNAFASKSLDKTKDSSNDRSKLIMGLLRIKYLFAKVFCCCCPNSKLARRMKDTTQTSPPLMPVESEVETDSALPGGYPPIPHYKAFDTAYARKSFMNFRSPHDSADWDDLTTVYSTVSDFIDDSDMSSELEDTTPKNCIPECIKKRMTCIDFDMFNGSDYGKWWNNVRTKVKMVVDNKFFEGLILLMILISSLTLAFEDIYLHENPWLQDILKTCNEVFTYLFTVEMVIKLVGLGIGVYFSTFWTILDFFIVCVSWVTLFPGGGQRTSQAQSLKTLRTLRALRPLRAISRWEGMKIVVNALMNAIPAIANVLMVCMVFWLIFSILAVNIFKGLFHKCVDKDGYRVMGIKTNKDCTDKGYTWQNSKINFDDTLNGFLALFQVATFEGWMEVMSDAADATEIDHSPAETLEDENQASYLFFVVFIIFGSFFSLNLFIGVIIDNFNVLKKKYEGSYLDAFLTSRQRDFINTVKRLAKKRPHKTIKRPSNHFQMVFYKISMSNRFELSIVAVIFFNMMIMAIEHYRDVDAVEETLFVMNVMFTTVFSFEALIKLIGLRLHYFRQFWNIFDFTIVILSLLDIIVYLSDESNTHNPQLDDMRAIIRALPVKPTLLRIIRVVRIGRVLRLIKSAKGIRKLLFALIISLPAIVNIGALLFLIMYMYSVIGMFLFQNIKIMDNGVLDEVVNFQTFGNSFMLLLRLATSGGWNDVLDALLIKPPYCNNTHIPRPNLKYRNALTWEERSNGECGRSFYAIPFMVTYVVFVWLIVINMYIAIILENFSQAHEQEELGITEDDFDMYYNVWERYDPHATQFIKYEELADFVNDLEPPLQIKKPNEIQLVSFNLPILDDDQMHCLDILIALVKRVLGNIPDSDELDALKEQMERKFHHLFPCRVNITLKSSTLQRKKEDVAARTLQKNWRSWKAQRAMRNITALAVKQRLRRASAIGLRSRTDTMAVLSNRLSHALTVYFSTRKPPLTMVFPPTVSRSLSVTNKTSFE